MAENALKPSLSKIGRRMSQLTGVRAIMKDISEVLRSPGAKDYCDLSAGNPIIIPQIEELWRETTRELLSSPQYGNVVCRYGMTHGYEPLLSAVVKFFNKEYGLNLTEKNVLITPGSQSLYFFAANAFSGYNENDRLMKVVLPLCPDYTGYGGICVAAEAISSRN
jgi:valine--pyruvate aminotransferase